ncbi:MAG TPA: hypothetical protein VGN89_09360, partial [Phenylobacterium sp.]|nr:hypothetical protein [Phenylobacterium sp.]
MAKSPPLRGAPAALFVALALALAAGGAHAQGVRVEDFAKVQAELARQAKVIEAQQREIDALRAERVAAPAPAAEPPPAVAVIPAPV